MSDNPIRNRRRNPNKLYRDPVRGKILGVCAGIADYFGFEPWTVRIGAVIGLFVFTLPTLIAYLLAGALLERKPADMYASADEEGMWRDIRTKPSDTVREVRHRFRELERRLRALEAHITSREFELSRSIRDLER